MTPTQLPTSEVLNRAADLIEERGWVTGSQGWPQAPDSTAPVCLEGGIIAALGRFNDGGESILDPHYLTLSELRECPAYVAVRNHLADRTWFKKLYLWNDQQAGSAEAVVEVLRATAVIEAAREHAALPAEASS